MGAIHTFILFLCVFALATMVGCSAGRKLGEGPQYGCWCGGGFPPPNEDPRPIDDWDYACRTHDRCYDRRGMDNEYCDRGFALKLDQLYLAKGYIPAQLQAAFHYYYSKLTPGYAGIWINIAPRDLMTKLEAGKNCF